MIVGQLVAQPAEAFAVIEDFAAELAPGESIAAPAVISARDYATMVDTTSAFLFSTIGLVVGTKVAALKKAGAGAHGETHIVTITISTTAAPPNVYQHEVELMIQES